MQLIKIWQYIIVLILLQSASIFAQPATEPQTFCNPLNLDYRFMVDAVDAREAADAVIILYKDDYYLFASRSGGYWTSPNLRDWTLIVPEGIDVELYAPAVLVMRDTVFYIPGNNSQIYKTADPKSGIWEKGPVSANYGDPAFFLDDDDRLYMCYGLSNNAPTGIVELDPYTFKEIGSKTTVVTAQANIHGWERRGDDNLLDEEPWIEGTWLVKDNGKYYYHYAGPGTEFKTYADGIYVADSPLGPYEYATYSPFAFKPTGFISGAGHGSTFQDKQGKYWRVGTMAISVNHMFERRLALYPVSFDEYGQIRCNTVFGDYPQYNPGVVENHIEDNFAGMFLLSHKKYVTASSFLPGYESQNAVDEESRTFWSAVSGNPGEWLLVDLGKECDVEAIQVNFGEFNTIPELVRGRDKELYEQYYIEESTDGNTWSMLVDKSQNMKDVPHDYIELENSVSTRYLRITNVYSPGEGNFALRGFRVFGNSSQGEFFVLDNFTVDRDTTDGRDAVITWPTLEGNDDGCIIKYGTDPARLYNNYMVYDADSVSIHSLNHGVEYYFSVTAFESQTDYYSPAGEIRSYQSGDWNDLDTWEKFDGTKWIHPSPNIPVVDDGLVSILKGDTVTVTASDSIDQLIVMDSALLVINQAVEFKVKNNLGDDLMASGTILNYGTLSKDNMATISFFGNGLYIHGKDGGIIPEALWREGSTCEVNNVVFELPGNCNQDFYNFRWNCQGQVNDMYLGFSGNEIGGDVIVDTTGVGILQLCDPNIASQDDITINGDMIQNGGIFAINNPGNNNAVTIHQKGNINAAMCVFAISHGTDEPGNNTTWNIGGDISLQDVTTWNASKQHAAFVFNDTSNVQKISFSNVNFATGGFPMEIEQNVTLNMGISSLMGEGRFILKPGATLITSHPEGVNGALSNTGTIHLSKASNFVFNGVETQVTGSLLPDTVNNLTVNNSAGLTLSETVSVNGTLDMVEGSITPGTNSLIYLSNAMLRYSGADKQTTGNGEFPSTNGPKNLIIDNVKNVVLHESRAVKMLNLMNKLELGSNTLTVDSILMKDATTYIITSEGGALKIPNVGSMQVLFPVGIKYYTPVWITNDGTEDAISVNAMADTETDNKGNSVMVKWNISEDNAGGGDYTVQLGWAYGLESAGFRKDRENKAKIMDLSDTTEVGSGVYSSEFTSQPLILSRGGITELGTFGVGVFENITSIKKITDDKLNGYLLYQNIPNPFSTTSKIPFDLPDNAIVSFKIYTMIGEVVMNISGKEMPAGKHFIVINAHELTNGIYYYSLEANDFVRTKRMIIMK